MSTVIAAIATPTAVGGLGVIRLSGDEALTVAERVFRPVNQTKRLSAMDGYTAAYGHVFDADGDIDECVATVFRAPHSYTGENVAELSCHGGVYLLSRVLRAVFAAGAVPAAAGEFTRRAFLNGKLDLTQAEAVAALIAADGKLAAKTALATREGAVFARLQTMKETLVGLQAQFSAFVDYPDDDIPPLHPDELGGTLETVKHGLADLLSTYDAGRVLREGVDTVIVGSPNVGKSTLMNLLSGCERSIVTDVAGTTRDVVEETVRVGNVCLRLADTAGLRDTDDRVEAIGVERSRERLNRAALVLAVFDGSRPLSDDDRDLLQTLPAESTIAIINKQDLTQNIDVSYISDKIQQIVYTDAKNGTGKEALTAAIEQVTGVNRLTGEQPVLANERQRACAYRAAQCVDEALDALALGMTADAVSVSVDGALDAILELTGERTTETVVDGIFARFCVGK